jgi:hypothetical protein
MRLFYKNAFELDYLLKKNLNKSIHNGNYLKSQVSTHIDSLKKT